MLLVLSLFEIFGLCHLRLLIGYCILSPSLTVQAIVFRSLRDLKFREWGHNSLQVDTYGIPLTQVLSLLVEELAVHVGLESDAVTINRVFEMAVLCDRQRSWSSFTPNRPPQHVLESNPYLSFATWKVGEPLDQAIKSLRQQRVRLMITRRQ
ncbi:hypothetical protein BGW80DRAFT_1286841 [Lactifluus volemus]|nr:hypothetical protein BGW80DRAFT_1286841 [Lactifluus volemus]